jgi:hypothetical protein
MSTKTTFKRIALVTVAALGFGMLSFVTPQVASAAVVVDNDVIKSISTGSVTSTYKVGRIGYEYAQELRITTGSAGTASKDGSLVAQFTTVPSGSLKYAVSTASGAAISPSFTVTTGSAAGTTLFTTGSGAVGATAASGATPLTIAIDAATNETIAGSASKALLGNFAFTPDVAGTYKLLVWSDSGVTGNTDGTYDSGEQSTTITIVVGGAPATVEIKAASATAATTNTGGAFTTGAEGGAVLVRLKDTAGNVTVPTASESVALSSNLSTGSLTDGTLSTGDFDTSGWAVANLYSSTAGQVVITATPGGAINTLAAQQTAITFTVVTVSEASAFSVSSTKGTDATALSALTGSASVGFGTNTTSVTYRLSASSTADSVSAVQIIDTSGVFTGRKDVAYSLPVSVTAADGYGSITITTAFATAATGFKISAPLATNTVVTMTSAAPIANATNSTITPSVANATTGGSLELTATAKDQFKNLLSTAVVAWSVAGRNATTVTTQKLTDTNGISTFTVTDASTSTTSLIDTVSASITYNGTAVSPTAASVTWGANTVKTVAYTVTPTLDDAKALSLINTGASGASASTVTLTVLVTGSTGLPLAGVPVKFASSSAKTGILVSSGVDYSTRYTDAAGKATTYVYGWEVGSTTVTATAGGVAGTTTVNFTNAATDARNIAVSVPGAGSVVKAVVTDRYGNPVKGATVTWSRTGTGYFGNGTTGTTGTTDASGVTEVIVSGDAVVTGELSTTTYTQAKDAEGFVNTVAIVATGIGASFKSAGTSTGTATVTAGTSASESTAQAAVDAAAEATDAANAATDAANAAAEAADAATAAAQDAADAVAALSAQVATLISGLKAQLTALTNLVIKIQKKVKA